MIIRRKILFICLVMITGLVWGQAGTRVDLQCTGLIDPGKRIFYLGVDNPFLLTVDSIRPDSLHVTASAGQLTGDNGQYNITFTDSSLLASPVYICMMSADTIGNPIFHDSIAFELQKTPKPEAIIAGRTGGKIKKETLLGADSLVVILRNCYLKNPYIILSFTLSYRMDMYLYEFEQRKGNQFTAQQRSAISGLPIGAFLHFEYIRVKGIGTDRKILPVLTFEISL